MNHTLSYENKKIAFLSKWCRHRHNRWNDKKTKPQDVCSAGSDGTEPHGKAQNSTLFLMPIPAKYVYGDFSPRDVEGAEKSSFKVKSQKHVLQIKRNVPLEKCREEG